MSLKSLFLLDINIRSESPMSLRVLIPLDLKIEGHDILVWRLTFFKLEQLQDGHKLQIQM